MTCSSGLARTAPHEAVDWRALRPQIQHLSRVSGSTGGVLGGSWRISKGARLHWRQWDDEFVVYNAASGDTHVLNIIAAEALRRLHGLLTLEVLVAQLADAFGIEPDNEFVEYVARSLGHLEQLDLVEFLSQ